MDDEKRNRQVALLCPTCGSGQFSYSGDGDEGDSTATCAGCGRQMTRDELLRENSENLDAHVTDLAKDVTNEFARKLNKSLREAFKGNKNVRFK